MELWIPITIAAAFFQNLRSAMQKYLKGKLQTSGATYARFVYALPFALLYLGLICILDDAPIPKLDGDFLVLTAIGAIAQIAATALLVHLFSYRNFAVGTTYSKTEVVQLAIFGSLFLGDQISALALFGIGVSLVGLLMISAVQGQLGWRALLVGLLQKPALIGIASGAFFAVSVVTIRGAALGLQGDSFVMRAALTMVVVIGFQTIAMGLWLVYKDPEELKRVFQNWRPGALVGLTGMLGSACWFTAFTLQNGAYVRALGQVELIFTFAASVLFFSERPSALEIFGVILVAAGIVLLLLG